MIYRKGKRYITMKDGKIFDEAVSSILKVQLDEIRTYMETHEGITEIAENGTDWVFKFDPFPEKIIRYIYSRKHKLHLRYCYRGGHFGYGMGRLTKDDVVYKHINLKNRTVLNEMIMPEINRWDDEGRVGYLEVIHSPVNDRKGRYPVAVKVTPDDLRKGSITLPGVAALHGTKTRTWNIPAMGKLALVFDPEAIYEYEKYETDYVARYETVMMESLTIITKTRNDIKKHTIRKAPWKALPNGINAYGTRTKTQTITIKRNDLYNNNVYGSQIRMYLDNQGDDGLVMAKNAIGDYTANAVQFKIRSTWYCEVRVKSNSMGWDFQVNRPPVEPSSGSGASSYTTPVIALNSDVNDLEFIIIEK